MKLFPDFSLDTALRTCAEQPASPEQNSRLLALVERKAQTLRPAWPKISRLGELKRARDGSTLFLTTALGCLGHMARAGGTRDSMKLLELYVRNAFHLTHDELVTALRIVAATRSEQISFEKSLEVYGRIFAENPQMLLQLIAALIAIAYERGEPSSAQWEMLRRVSESYNYPVDEMVKLAEPHQLLAQYRNLAEGRRHARCESSDTIREKLRDSKDPLRAACRVLGCDRLDSAETIRACYRKLVFEHHPDRVAAKGRGAKEVAEARERFKEILKAYDMLRRAVPVSSPGK